MVLYAAWLNIFFCCRGLFFPRDMSFSASSTRAASSGNYFSWSHLLRRTLTNMDWAQNRAQVTLLSLRESIITLTGKLRPSTFNSHSSWSDPQNQLDWREGWGINHFKNNCTGQRTWNPLLQLQPATACISTVLTRRKSYATIECGVSSCRVELFHVQGTQDF